jgi:hypothetical protein
MIRAILALTLRAGSAVRSGILPTQSVLGHHLFLNHQLSASQSIPLRRGIEPL